MELSRSTYYDSTEDPSIVEARLITRIQEICAEWPRYGYRRVTAQLRHEGIIVNHKKVMRLMKEHGLTVLPRRRFVATTDSDHERSYATAQSASIAPLIRSNRRR